MDKPLLILSIPNCGSDWLARTLFESQSELRYYREFFNPITNIKYADVLKNEFGCEYIECYKNIAKFDETKCQKIYEQTWELESYNFTKENYSAFKVDFFAKNFRCIALRRSVYKSLPASRESQVNSWYNTIYHSMLSNIDYLPFEYAQILKKHNQDNRGIVINNVMAFVIYQKILSKNCENNNIKILDYDVLTSFNEKNLGVYLDSFSNWIKVDRWIAKIVETRKPPVKPNYKNLNCDDVLKLFNYKML
jgi:hypothetical protein